MGGSGIDHIPESHRILIPGRPQVQVKVRGGRHEIVQIVRSSAQGCPVSGLVLIQQLQGILKHRVGGALGTIPLCQYPPLELIIELSGVADGFAILLIQFIGQFRSILRNCIHVLTDLRLHSIDQSLTLLILPFLLRPQGIQLLHQLRSDLRLHLCFGLLKELLGLLQGHQVLRVKERVRLRQHPDHSLQLRCPNGVADNVEGIGHHIRSVLRVLDTEAQVRSRSAQLDPNVLGQLHADTCGRRQPGSKNHLAVHKNGHLGHAKHHDAGILLRFQGLDFLGHVQIILKPVGVKSDLPSLLSLFIHPEQCTLRLAVVDVPRIKALLNAIEHTGPQSYGSRRLINTQRIDAIILAAVQPYHKIEIAVPGDLILDSSRTVCNGIAGAAGSNNLTGTALRQIGQVQNKTCNILTFIRRIGRDCDTE